MVIYLYDIGYVVVGDVCGEFLCVEGGCVEVDFDVF